jgi:hypothetical protein
MLPLSHLGSLEDFDMALRHGGLEAIDQSLGCFWADELHADRADGPVPHVHPAFQARSEAAVRDVHVQAPAAGGRDDGGPGLRLYGKSCHAAFGFAPPTATTSRRPGAQPPRRSTAGRRVKPVVRGPGTVFALRVRHLNISAARRPTPGRPPTPTRTRS